jgi:glycosyltransferase involved in cell wall biosynthesis
VSRGNVAILVENLSVPFDRRVWQEAGALRDAGFTVSVICPRGETYDVESYVELDGIHIHRYPLRPATGGIVGYGREYASALWHTRRLLGKVELQGPLDVVHACNPPDILLLAALSQRRRGARFVFDHHDLVPELYKSRFAGAPELGHRVTLLAERIAFRLADVVVTTNETYRRTVIARRGISPDDIFVVRSAPDLRRFIRCAPDPSLKRGRRHLIAYVGVMGPQDGLDYALRSLAELATRRRDWHAVFVGSGDCFEEMRELAHSLGLEGDVTFTGRVPNETLLSVLSTADVCLAPDPFNPLNDVSTMNKIVEYMAIGIPIVSFDLRESRASAADAAVYVPDNDVAAFAAAIDKLFDDPGARARMAKAGRVRAHGELAWERSAHNLVAAYVRALTSRA